MKPVFAFVLLSLASLPGAAFAQNGEPTSTPSPPPLPRSPQNPIGGPPPTTTPTTPVGPSGKVRPPPGGNRVSGLVGYLDSRMDAGPKDIDAPVTGYGNEALWDVGLMSDAVPAGDQGSAPGSKDATGSTAPPPKR